MQLLDQIVVKRGSNVQAVIQLLQGDLTAIPKDQAIDILILSAYPGSYVPVPTTLIAALNDKGISIEEMAKHKAIDLRDQLSCWLSEPLTTPQQEQFNFRKILCFEPWLNSTDPGAVVGNIFRCINTFAFSESVNVIAMPMLASGRQRVPIEKMLPAMLDASIFWLESGLPLTCIKLVLLTDEQTKAALPVFVRAKQQNELKQSVRAGNISGTDALIEIKKQEQVPGEGAMQIIASEINEIAQKENIRPEVMPAPAAAAKSTPRNTAPPAATASPAAATTTAPSKADSNETKPATADNSQYDYFISYAHKHADIIEAFVENLSKANNKLTVFYDKSSIPTGSLWIKQISDAIQKSKKILIFLSPDYSNSPVCWDEFQCAKLMEYNSKKEMIQTIYLFNDTAMPLIMGIYSWADCREGDKDKLQKIVTQLLC